MAESRVDRCPDGIVSPMKDEPNRNSRQTKDEKGCQAQTGEHKSDMVQPVQRVTQIEVLE